MFNNHAQRARLDRVTGFNAIENTAAQDELLDMPGMNLVRVPSPIHHPMSSEPGMSRKLILHVFPSFAAGGAQMRFVTLVNRIGASAMGGEFRHAIIALDGDVGCGIRLDPSLDVTFPALSLKRGTMFGNLPRIHRFLRQLRPDLLMTSNWGSVEWALANHLPRIPHVHAEDGFGPEERDRQIPRRVYTRRLALRRSQIILPSRILLGLATSIWRLPRSRLHYIPNGVDLTRFSQAAEKPRGGTAVIGCVAALRPEKNLGRLLRAAKFVTARHPVRLIIAGDGPERETLEALARELGLDAEFRGNVADPALLYREFDIFALTSDTEQMPLSVLEAMASGLPVAATAVGDIASMIATENQPYLTARDDQALAQAMIGLLDAPDQAQAIGQANRQKAEASFDEASMIANWRQLWYNAISRNTVSRSSAGRAG
jgi:glycosyltransferase involved in cell wall biosynthesis